MRNKHIMKTRMLPTLMVICCVLVTVLSGKHKSRFSIHLIGGRTPNEGYLGVHEYGSWHYVCNSFWDRRNSKVVCRQLGYAKAVYEAPKRTLESEVEGRSFLSEEIICEGSESLLSDCKRKPLRRYHISSQCSLSRSKVYITCSRRKDDDVIKLEVKKHPIRLQPTDDSQSNSRYVSSGLLQVFVRNRWFDVCADNWSHENSQIACSQLGYPVYKEYSNASNDISVYYFHRVIHCNGKESLLWECQMKNIFSEPCKSRKPLLLTCSGLDENVVITEKNGEIRLRGGYDDASGRVELFNGVEWGTVCDDGWDIRDANVVCRQLGFGSAYEATHWADDGEGLGKILLTDLNCYGNESSIKNCRRKLHNNLCTHSEDAGVKCHAPKPKQKVIRLVGGTRHAGRIEVLIKGEWAGICGIGFTQREGQIACKELDLGFVKWASRSYKYGVNYRKRMYDVRCHGNESSLFECSYGSSGRCRYYDMASVVCSKYAPDLVMDISKFKESIKVESHTLWELKCSYEERCLAPIVDKYFDVDNSKKRHLLKFTSRILNKGAVSFRPFSDKSDWQWHQCHDHYHSMETFAQYDIIDWRGYRVADGHKASFCLEDSECEPGFKKVYNCTDKGDQGISQNCADNYKNTIDCQWIDITELQEGNYSIRVHVNPTQYVAESDWLNNRAVCEIEYYDTDVKVKGCTTDPCYQESFGGNSFGHCCRFPFMRNNTTYYTCITDSDENPWCATTVNFDQDKKWGYCSETIEKTQPKKS